MNNRKIWIISIVSSILLIICIAVILLLHNLNTVLSQALMLSYNNSSLSEVYDLQFEDLSVNVFSGNITVHDVKFSRKEELPEQYAYINSTIILTTDKIELQNVEIFHLLRNKELELESIEIRNPDISLNVTGSNFIIFPINPSKQEEVKTNKDSKKKLQAYKLDKLELINANLHGINTFYDREFFVHNLQIILDNFKLESEEGKNTITNAAVSLSIDSLEGRMHTGPMRDFSLHNYKIDLDSFALTNYIDTSTFEFKDLQMSFNNLFFLTSDSTAQFKMDSLSYGYSQELLSIRNIQYIPNVAQDIIQQKYQYQTADLFGTVARVDILGIQTNSLLNSNSIIAESITVSGVNLNIYKDKTKPIDNTKFPVFPPQNLLKLKMPIDIKHVIAKDINIISKEKLPENKSLEVHVSKLEADVSNISNRDTKLPLTISGNGIIENTIPFQVMIQFDYDKPHFTFDVSTSSFDINRMNTLVSQIAPVTLDSGIVDRVRMQGNGYERYATGTMGFEYHGLEINILMEDKDNWINSVISLAANTYLKGSNPAKADDPPFVSKFKIERNMNKGSINMLMLSMAAGLKESLIMSRESKKDYKKVKSENKKKKKKEK